MRLERLTLKAQSLLPSKFLDAPPRFRYASLQSFPVCNLALSKSQRSIVPFRPLVSDSTLLGTKAAPEQSCSAQNRQQNLPIWTQLHRTRYKSDYKSAARFRMISSVQSGC